jgi:flagellar hook-associated protein 1 FlgK
MAQINRVLYTAKEALLSNLTAINITGSNISNVNTPGYTRLRAVFESVGATNSTASQEQIGVRIAAIEQVYDRFLESQLVAQQSSVSNYTAQKEYLQRIEGILNENNGGGINDAMPAFLNAWGDLSVDPSSKAKRDQVLSAGQNLSYLFNQRADSLTTIRLDANESVADNVTLLNDYLRQMADFNSKIVYAESAGGNASALRDKRVELLKKISGMIDVNYIETSNGALYVTLPSNGKALVEGSNSWQLQVQNNPTNNNMYDIVFSEDPSQSINAQISGGTLAGLLQIRDAVIPSYLDQLNQTASSIINKVNELHSSGYDQNGSIGGAFFVIQGTSQYASARNMAVNPDIVADTRKIAASATVNADGNNAAAITSILTDQMYASVGQVIAANHVTAQVNNIGQVYKNTTSNIVITRGATSLDWTVTNNGGYSALSVLSSSDSVITLDFNGDNFADMTLNLTGLWSNTDTISFGLAKDSSTTTIDGYFNAFISNMGQDVVNVDRRLQSETVILNQQSDQREQVSGVSLDEEMINLIKYQMAYGAAGKMTKTVSDLMDLLISLAD